MIDCAKCHKPVDGDCNTISNDYSMWFLHPACYEQHVTECEARAQEHARKLQQVERMRIAEWNALIQWNGWAKPA